MLYHLQRCFVCSTSVSSVCSIHVIKNRTTVRCWEFVVLYASNEIVDTVVIPTYISHRIWKRPFSSSALLNRCASTEVFWFETGFECAVVCVIIVIMLLSMKLFLTATTKSLNFFNLKSVSNLSHHLFPWSGKCYVSRQGQISRCTTSCHTEKWRWQTDLSKIVLLCS